MDATCELTQNIMCHVFSLPSGWTPAQSDALVAQLREATQQVVLKWPLMRGLASKKKGTWTIDVPDDASTRATHFGFTCKTVPQPYHVASGLPAPLPAFNGLSSGALSRPKRSLFRPSSVPSSLAGHARARYPFLHVHVSVLADAITVGVNLPHGIVDGTGMGIVLRALTAELHGQAWEAPPAFAGVNPWQAAMDRLVDGDEESGGLASAESSRSSGSKSDLSEKGSSSPRAGSADAARRAALPATGMWRPFAPWPALRLLSSVFVENAFRKSERGWVLLNHATIDRLVKRVKEEVKAETGGAEFVSTGDILFAWALKAAHSGESSSSAGVSAGAVWRSTALLPVSEVGLYPHNAIAPYFLISPLSLPTLASLPLSTLALHMRRNLLSAKTRPVLRSAWREVRKGAQLPHRDWPQLPGPRFPRRALAADGPGASDETRGRFVTYWGTSNQIGLGLAGLSLPAGDAQGTDLPLLAFQMDWVEPINVDHLLMLTDNANGVQIAGTMRRSRWKALKKAVEELERGTSVREK
ncbi:hypothetical protein JCM10449v2_004521 [Rhodotorula kratochvilovae]